ncbi:hypothetical protein [aff. Roholtiella sp. LEGE 12411]|nr:hypothetical protein [aff. Roholtiella sp. LEGE 12411]
MKISCLYMGLGFHERRSQTLVRARSLFGKEKERSCVNKSTLKNR